MYRFGTCAGSVVASVSSVQAGVLHSIGAAVRAETDFAQQSYEEVNCGPTICSACATLKRCQAQT